MNIRTFLAFSFVALFLFSCINDDIYYHIQGDTNINNGLTIIIPKHKLKEVAHFSGISIKLPNNISPNLNTKKLIFKGKEYDIFAQFINFQNDSIRCEIGAIGSDKIIMMLPGYSNRRFKQINIYSDLAFESKGIEWFSTDKF